MSIRSSRRLLATTAAVAMFAGLPTSVLAVPQAAAPVSIDDDFDTDVRVFNDHIVTLANPFMEGRVPGSRGMEIAKEYFEHYLREAGVEPGFVNGTSYRQAFPLGGTVEITGQSISASVGGKDFSFAPDVDQTATSMGSSGTVTGEMVFVGYSIDNGQDGYSNYGNDTDLTGKVAVMYRFNPMDDDGKNLWNGTPWSNFAGFDNKIRGAAERGAAGIIIVNTPGAADPRAGQLLSNVSGANNAEIPVMMMTAEAGSRLLDAASDRTAMELRRFADAGGGTVDLDGSVTISAKIDRNPLMAENVGGLLPGKGRLKDEYIVIGAHLDHLGMGYFGSRSGAGELHPGADDNASGSAAVLMLADKLVAEYAEMPDGANARGVLFVGFSAEESGLNGSRFYVENPIAPIDDHDLMINFDMIGRIKGGRLNVTGSNSAQGFETWLAPYYEASELEIVQTDRFARGGSDHGPFRNKGVPILFGIIADFHADYHTPADVSWKINREDSVRTVYLFRDIALAAAQRAEPLIFSTGEEPASRPAPQARQAPEPPAEGRGGARVRVGIQPSDYDSTNGIPVGSVVEGSPAEKAGLKSGDVIVSWNKKPVKTIDDYMEYAGQAKPGDVVDMGIRRGESVIVLKVKLEAAEG